jgi:hypothetical protein
MRPVRVIKSFADLRAAIAEVAAETPSIAQPPMTPTEVQHAARAFAEYRRTARDKRLIRLDVGNGADDPSETSVRC